MSVSLFTEKGHFLSNQSSTLIKTDCASHLSKLATLKEGEIWGESTGHCEIWSLSLHKKATIVIYLVLGPPPEVILSFVLTHSCVSTKLKVAVSHVCFHLVTQFYTPL